MNPIEEGRYYDSIYRSNIPMSNDISSYKWYSNDEEFQQYVMNWINEGFANTYNELTDIELIFWLHLNGYYPANPCFGLQYIFKETFLAFEEELQDTTITKSYIDALYQMYFEYLYKGAEAPKSFEETIDTPDKAASIQDPHNTNSV